MKVISLPILHDNYVWILFENQHCVIVDPGESWPVIDFIKTNQLTLDAIIVTHHHYDHVDGIAEIVATYPCPVYGPEERGFRVNHHVVKEADCIEWQGPDIQVLETPGHTKTHLSYLLEEHLFCGDTLFALGCGRIFDGSAEQFHQSLQRLSGLPRQTKICCTHEYTLSNAQFALHVDPENEDLQIQVKQYKKLRAEGKPTLPVELGSELKCNPFLRVNEKEIKDSLNKQNYPTDTALQCFRSLRQWKDGF